MLIGNRSSVAVEFELSEEYGGVWLFGKFCYWLKKQCIGDFEYGTSLRDIFFELETIIQYKGNREHKELFSLSAFGLFYRIDNALYGAQHSNDEERAMEESWARFNVTLSVDIFSGWKIFLIEDCEDARIITGRLNEDGRSYNNIYEVTLKCGEFDRILNEAYKEMNKLCLRELSREKGRNRN